jgi:NTF2 fold immunity protein
LEFGRIGGIIGTEQNRGSMKMYAVLACALIPVTLAVGQGYRPPSGYVPDSATAVQIAEAVLVPIYGKKQIESEKPFTATLEGDVWTVGGTLRCPDGKGGTTTKCDGGVAVVKISKMDARILFVIHGK